MSSSQENKEFEVVGVYVGEEGQKKVEEENKNKIQVPPFPDGVLEWSETDFKNNIVPEDIQKMGKVCNFKILRLWEIWGIVRQNPRLIELVNTNIPTTRDDSDEFFLKQIIVLLIDQMGKILNGKTDISRDIWGN